MPEAGRNYYTALPQLRFPKDKPSDYKGVIEFRLVTIEPAGVNLGTVGNIFNALFDDNPTSSGFNDLANANVNTNTITNRKEYPSKFPNVTLYLPQAIVFNDGMEYDNNVQLGIVGAIGERSMNNGGSITEALTNAVAAGAGSFTDLFKDLPTQDLARLALARGAGYAGQLAGDVASSVTRTTINPNRRTLFRGVRSREFGFSFKMIANSAAEAQEIQDIISFFRREMYPQSVDYLGISAGYKYPNPFRIDLKYGSARIGTRILNSYLGSMQTTYNQSSMGFHVDGQPSEVDITLSFFEERALSRDDIQAGY